MVGMVVWIATFHHIILWKRLYGIYLSGVQKMGITLLTGEALGNQMKNIPYGILRLRSVELWSITADIVEYTIR